MTDEPTVVFVIGTGRCGSTLVHDVVCRHRGIGFLSNLEDRWPLPAAAGRANGAVLRRIPPDWTRKGRPRLAPSEGYRRLAAEVGPVVVDPGRDLTAADATPWLVDRLRRFLLDRAGDEPVVLHKFTGWPRVGFLAAAFPGARFVHVVRDGRAVANSWLQMPWWRGHLGPAGWHFGPLDPDDDAAWRAADRDFAVLAGLGWRMLVRAAEATRGDHPWLTVRYEDVLTDPGRRLGEIVDFCGLGPDPGFAEQVERHRFSPARRHAFRDDLTPRQVAALEDLLADDLARYGYLDGRAGGPPG